MRCVMDLLRPQQSKIERKNVTREETKCKAVPEYTEGEVVLFRDFSNNNNSKWSQGTVYQKTGNLHYKIQCRDKFFKRHIDQLRKNHLPNFERKNDDTLSSIPELVNLQSDNDAVSPGPASVGERDLSPQSEAEIAPVRRSSRTNVGIKPVRYGYASSYEDYSSDEF